MAVQGFGNAGSVAANLLHDEQGATIVAVSDSKGGIYKAEGMNPHAIEEYKKKTGSVVGFPGTKALSNEEVLEAKVDILVPAALENQITKKNADKIGAKIVAEAANGPTLPEADTILYQKKITVLPDILANAGGVTVSYFEWAQDIQGFFWPLNEVNERLERIMVRSYADVHKVAVDHKVHNRTAAYILAIQRVADAIKTPRILPVGRRPGIGRWPICPDAGDHDGTTSTAGPTGDRREVLAADAVPQTIVGLTRGGWVPARSCADLLGVQAPRLAARPALGSDGDPGRGGRAHRGDSGSVDDQNVLIVDDITDTGESLELARQHVIAARASRLETATFLHISHSKFVPTYYAEEIPRDSWVWIVFPWNYWEDLRSLAARAAAETPGLDAVRRTLSERCGLVVSREDLIVVSRTVPLGKGSVSPK